MFCQGPRAQDDPPWRNSEDNNLPSFQCFPCLHRDSPLGKPNRSQGRCPQSCVLTLPGGRGPKEGEDSGHGVCQLDARWGLVVIPISLP